MVNQPRIGTGGLSYQFATVMADDLQDFKAVAVREIHEKVGVICDINEMIPLSERPNDPCTFINEERYVMGCYVFLVQKNMKIADILAYQGKIGEMGENEQIELEIVKFDDVRKYVHESASLGTRYG